MNDQDLVLDVKADTTSLERSFLNINRISRTFATSLTGAFEKVAIRGKDLDDVLRGLVERLSSSAFNSAMRPIENGLSNLIQTGLTGLFSGFGGGGGTPLPITPFASGGVISEPSFFRSGGGLGVMGEAGPEAIMPLARGPDGKLGVRSSASSPTSVSVTIQTPDAESFRRSRGRVATELARAVDHGRRYL